MRLCHPPDGSTSPKYKLLCLILTKKICKEKNALAFNRDRCCHLVLCLWLIPFHLHFRKKVRIDKILTQVASVGFLQTLQLITHTWKLQTLSFLRTLMVFNSIAYIERNNSFLDNSEVICTFPFKRRIPCKDISQSSLNVKSF